MEVLNVNAVFCKFSIHSKMVSNRTINDSLKVTTIKTNTKQRGEKKNQRPKRHIAMRLSIQLIIHFMLHISIQHFECESFVGAHIGRMILLFNISSEFVRLFVHSLESTKPSKQFHLGWFPILMRFYSYFRLDDLLNAFFLHIFNSL